MDAAQIDTISQLHIFHKETDANAVIRGFEYQKLKTLEAWIDTFNHKDEELYCEYEDDIMQFSPEGRIRKFRQIKMYSSSFSINSNEVKKALTNFFMLFCNPAYQTHDTYFYFETNTNLASRSDNLLQEWIDHQEAIPDKLLFQCLEIVKNIVNEQISQAKKLSIEKIDNKIDARRKKLKTNINETAKSKLEVEIIDLENTKKAITEVAETEIDEKIFIGFVKRIRWQFLATSPDQAINDIVKSIIENLLKLPYGILRNETEPLLARLLYFISQKSMAELPEARRLTFGELERLILNRNEDDDKWYVEVRDQWQQIDIDSFLFAEFYEIVSASRHCRYTMYLWDDSKFWINILETYLSFPSIPNFAYRKALYEICMLTVKLNINHPGHVPTAYLHEKEQYVLKYLSDLEHHINIPDLEDAITLLSVVAIEIFIDGTSLTEEEWKGWTNRLDDIINQSLETATPNLRCGLLECKATLALSIDLSSGVEAAFRQSLRYIKDIVQLLPEAPFYSVYQLSNRLNEQIKQITQGGYDELLDEFIEISDVVDKLVGEREGNFKLGKNYVEKGYSFLKAGKFARAASSLHKAKELWLKQETVDGFVLACLSISQVYAGLNLNLAAKQYALVAGWTAANTGDPQLIKRLAEAWYLISHYDFKQGAWISFLDSYANFIDTSIEFNPSAFEKDKEDDNRSIEALEALPESLLVQYIANRYLPSVKYLVDYKLNRNVDIFGVNYLNEIVETFSSLLGPESGTDCLNWLERNKIDAEPFSDLGPKRTIRWWALGSEWIISFTNDWHSNAVGEQFVAILQILQLEFSNEDLHLVKAKVEVDLSVKYEDNQVVYNRLDTNAQRILWQCQIPTIDTIDIKDFEQINTLHRQIVLAAYSLIQNISLLPVKNTLDLFLQRTKEQGLPAKTLVAQPYERIYRRLIILGEFNEPQRHIFESSQLYTNFHLPQTKELKWKSDLSPLYNREKSLKHITNRYNGFQSTLNRTLSNLNHLAQVKQLFLNLRSEGYLDWQILLAVQNLVISYKANILVEKQGPFPSEHTKIQALRRIAYELSMQDENQNFIPIPINYLFGNEFEFQLSQVPFAVLESFGLASELLLRDTSPIREFLTQRFKFSEDDTEHPSVFE